MTQLFILMTVLICSSLRIDGRTDFKCVLTYQNWKWPTHMTINWIIPPPVFHREDLDVNITWYTSFNIGSCPEFTLTSCSWNYGHGMNFDENFYLSVIIYHKATENIVFKNEWEVNPDDCRKPPPVDKVFLETKNSTCINVTWWYDEKSGCSTFDHKYYHISYRNNGTTGMKDYKYEYETLETSCNTSQIFCYLQPFANYVFNIQTKFSDWQRKIRGHYSSEKLASIRTPEDVPAGAPGITSGCFTMVQNKCTDENIRDIRIYWKDVASDLKHGIITRFMVDIFIEEPHRKRHVTASSVHGNSYNYLASISCDSDYEIRLRAATSIGVSSDYSALFIPRINIDYQDVIQDVIPVIANNSFHVYWLNKSGTNTSLSDDYRVFWCYKDIENRCKSPINWREVSEKQTYGNVPEQAVSVPEQAGSVAHRYRFGIGYFETGIKWSRCLYTQTEDSQPPVGLNLVAYKSSAVGSMTIYWDNLPCESHPPSPYIDQFIVTICKLKDKEKTLCQDKPVTKTVNGGRKNFAFNNLDTGTMYLVCVQSQGLSRHHLGPKNCISGQSASLRTIPFHPAIITLIVLCSVVVVSVITCGVVKLLRTNKKDFKITVPASFRESDQELLSRGTRLSEYLPLTDYQRHQTSSNSSLDT